MENVKEIMTCEDVAEYMQLSLSYVYTLCRTGQIPHIKLGKKYRIPKVSLDRWLARQAENIDIVPAEDVDIYCKGGEA